MDRDQWNARYRETELLWSAGPNHFVVQHTGGLRPGRALDVACGEGRNAVWLAEQGWDVVGVDFSDVAISRGAAMARERGVAVDLRVGDVTTPETVDGTFDLVLVCYLHLGRSAMAALLAGLVDRVAPGGTMLVIGHHVDNPARGVGGPPDPAVLHDPDVIAGVIAGGPVGLEVVSAGEAERVVTTADGERTAIDSVVVARRPG